MDIYNSLSHCIFTEYIKERKKKINENQKLNFEEFIDKSSLIFLLLIHIFIILYIALIMSLIIKNNKTTIGISLCMLIILFSFWIIEDKDKGFTRNLNDDYEIISKLLEDNCVNTDGALENLIIEAELYLKDYEKLGKIVRKFLFSSFLVIETYVITLLTILSSALKDDDDLKLVLDLVYYLAAFSILSRFALAFIDASNLGIGKTSKYKAFIGYLYQIRTDKSRNI